MTGRSVLISGAGIAGPTLAYWLTAAGYTPTIIEQAPELRGGGYVIDFWGHGYDIAERMGLIDDIECVGYHMREMRVVDAAGRRIAGFGTRMFDALTGGRFITLPRSELSRLLFERAAGPAQVMFDDEVVDLREEADHVRVRFKNGGQQRFDIVIGADGLHSQIRKLVFGPQHQFEKSLGYAVAAFEVVGYRPRDLDVYVMRNEPGRMIGRVALRKDRTLFLFVFATDHDARTSDLQRATLHRQYSETGWECPQILHELDRSEDLYFDKVSQIRMPRWSRGRVALIGDAAFCVSLAAGQGSALAMISAYVLAHELANTGDHRKAFANYEAKLRPFMERKQQAAERFASALAPATEFGLWFRNLVIHALAIPGIARTTLGRDIADTISLPKWES
jgi:2-polyprenyl-6-methoxyphenol hydroxylase-like FAD-dependent oxidoreductase